MKKTSTSNRIISYDVLRIYAALCVIMIHVALPFVTTFPTDSVGFVVGNLFDSISRTSVPIFLMISGALMLNEDKKRTSKDMLSHSFGLFWLMVVWSVLYALFEDCFLNIVGGEAISVAEIVESIVSGPYHLWFLSMMIGLYLLTPVLRVFIKKENKKYISYYLLFSIVVESVIPFLDFFAGHCLGAVDPLSTWMDDFNLFYLDKYLTYYILGWYLSTFQIGARVRRWIYVLGGLGFITTFLGVHHFTTETMAVYDTFYAWEMINVLCASVAVFLSVHRHVDVRSARKREVVVRLSELTFGVYIVHLAVLTCMEIITVDLAYPILKLVILFVSTVVISFAGVYVISKTPVLRKLIRG